MAEAKHKHIVILGMPRSGTTLLYALLANSLKHFRYFDGERSALSIETIDAPIITKRPLDCMLIEKIKRLGEDRSVRILFCIRDPRDVVCSVHPSVPHDYFIGFRNQYFVVKDHNICQPTNPGLRDIVEQYLTFRDEVLTVRYEDLVSTTAVVRDRIAEFVAEDIGREFLEMSEGMAVPKDIDIALGGKRAIDTHSIGQWKKHPKRVWEEFTENIQMHDLVELLGYEKNRKWFFDSFKAKIGVEVRFS